MKIVGTGSFLPEFILTNEMLSKVVDTSDEWILERTGIRERRISRGEPIWHMATEAAKAAMDEAGVKAEEIDLILCTTVSNDYNYPSLSCVVQDKIGAKNAFCFDIGAACAAFIYALDIISNYFALGKIKTALLVSSEQMSKGIDYKDRSTCVLFGDGAGACVIKADDKSGLIKSFLGADGSSAGLLVSHAWRIDHIFADEEVKAKFPDYCPESRYLHMEGRDVFKFASRAMVDALEKVLHDSGVDISEVSYIIPHQANMRIIQLAAQKFNFPMERVYVNLDRVGNTSSASIPICLDEMNKQGLLKRGDKLIFVGFGSGMTYGAALLQW